MIRAMEIEPRSHGVGRKFATASCLDGARSVRHRSLPLVREPTEVEMCVWFEWLYDNVGEFMPSLFGRTAIVAYCVLFVRTDLLSKLYLVRNN